MSCYLFDFDGTLVDSMPTFGGMMLRILDECGAEYPSNIIKTITPLGFAGTARYFIGMGVKKSEAELLSLMYKYAYDAYSNTIASSGVLPVRSPIPNKEQLIPEAPYNQAVVELETAL